MARAAKKNESSTLLNTRYGKKASEKALAEAGFFEIAKIAWNSVVYNEPYDQKYCDTLPGGYAQTYENYRIQAISAKVKGFDLPAWKNGKICPKNIKEIIEISLAKHSLDYNNKNTGWIFPLGEKNWMPPNDDWNNNNSSRVGLY